MSRETYKLSATRDFRIVDAEGTSSVIKKKKTILRGRGRGQSQSKMSYKRTRPHPGMLQNYTFAAARTRVDRGLCFPGWVTVGPTASPKYSVPGAKAAA